ncbi:zinc finger, CCHC-type containing protein [Tanacetum coccineum]
MHLAWLFWSDLRVIPTHGEFRSLVKPMAIFARSYLMDLNRYRDLRIVLSVEDKLPYLEQPIPIMSVPPAGQVLPPDVLNTHIAWVKALKEIVGLMLMTMDPDIQKNPKQLGAYDMLKELKTLYAHQAEQELLQTVRELHACKQEEEQSISSYVLKMMSYIDNLERLGHAMTQNLSKNQKKKSHKAAKGNQGKGKAKMGNALVPAPSFAPKPKNPPTPKKDNPAKDAICHQCGEVGHWRRNCLVYLAELLKKKKLSQGASTSCIFTYDGRKAYSHQVKRAKVLLGLIYTDDYALESVARILNMVPTKKVDKTPYKVWHGQDPKLSYLKVWETMGYSFYYPPKKKIFVAQNAEFLENSLINHEEDDQEINEPQSDINPIRKSIRTRRALDRMCLHVDAEEHELGDLGESANYKAALLDPESDKWLNAMNLEMQSMRDITNSGS